MTKSKNKNEAKLAAIKPETQPMAVKVPKAKKKPKATLNVPPRLAAPAVRIVAPVEISSRARSGESPRLSPALHRAVEEALGCEPSFLTDVISWHAHVPFLWALLDLLKPKLAVELGVHKGDSLLSTAEGLQKLGQPGRVVGIDTWKGDDHAGFYPGDEILADLMGRAAPFGLRVSLIRSTFDAALSSFETGSIDLLHIDGLHTYEAVRHDFRIWMPMLSRRGVVMFHDTAVMENGFGVHRFWDEIKDLGPSFNFPFGNGLGVLAIGADVPETVVELLQALGQDEALLRKFTLAGTAQEHRSYRHYLERRVADMAASHESERHAAGEEITRLNALIEQERAIALGRFGSLEAEIDSGRKRLEEAVLGFDADQSKSREAAASEFDRLNKLIEEERTAAGAEMNRLNLVVSEAEATVVSVRQASEAEIHRLGLLADAARNEAESLRQTAETEIRQLNQLIETERQTAADEFQRLNGIVGSARGEAETLRQSAEAEIRRLNQLIEAEREAAAAEFQRLNSVADAASGAAEALRQTAETEIRQLNQLIEAEREAAAAEVQRLSNIADIAQSEAETQRRTAETEIARLTQLIEAERETAAAEFQRLNSVADAARSDAESLRQTAAVEIAQLNKLIEEERAIATNEFQRLGALVDVAEAEQSRLGKEKYTILEFAQNTRAALERERSETERLSALLSEMSERHAADMSVLERERDQALAELRANASEALASLDDALAKLQAETAASAEQAALLASLSQEAEAYRNDAERQFAEFRLALAAADANATALATATASLDDLQKSIEKHETTEHYMHGLLAEDRVTAAREFDRLNTLIETERSTAQTEFDRLNREINILHRDYLARLEAARLKSRAKRAFKKVAFPVFRMLPLPRKLKNRLRLSIVSRYGESLGLVPPKTPALASQTGLSLRGLTGQYLPLARASTGAPANLPPRSVSIIIPVYNQLEYTLRCIDAIKLHTADIDHEIIVVDDCSADMTGIVLSPRRDIIYLRNPQNLGFIGSCNHGLEHASKTYVCFLNNDTEVTPQWLSALVDSFEMHPNVGLAGSQLIYPDGRLQEAGGIIWDDFSGWNWGRLQDPTAPKFTYARMADYCSGASILLPRELALAVGGFDPEFTPAYGEDSDLAFRLRAMGLSTLYQPLSRVVHYEGVTSGTDTSKGVKAYQVVNAAKLKERWAHVLPAHGANGVDPDKAVERGKLGRILVIDQITPEPDKDAGSITALELMLSLRDLGYKVVFVPLSNFTYIPNYTDLLGGLGIESVLYPWARSVEEHLETVGDVYDAVVIFRFNTAVDTVDVIRRKAPKAKVIFHNSDLHFLREERARAVDNPNAAELRNATDQTKTQELGIIQGADCCIVHSHFERDLLAELAPSVPVVVFPWTYEPRGAGNPWEKRSDIVFLGGYRHYPNVDAVLNYAENVAPILSQRLHGTRFHAIGSNPPAELLALASNHLAIDGFIEDLGPVLSSARVMLVPLRYGAGLKGKIITAMAHGLPVVTTSVGAEGMALTHGENVLIADTPSEMADAIVRLYTDRDLWNRLSRASLDFVARTTSREAGHQIVGNILSVVNLPSLPRIGGIAPATSFNAAIGTPKTFLSGNALALAARQALGLPEGVALDLVMPSDAALARLESDAPPATRFVALNAEGHVPPGILSGKAVLVLDAFDDATVSKTARNCARDKGQISAILFLPPRLEANARGYAMTHALSGKALKSGAARTPVHLRHLTALEAAGLSAVWIADARISGFPSMTVAKLTR
jgi:GT2 family glycosyltransferase